MCRRLCSYTGMYVSMKSQEQEPGWIGHQNSIRSPPEAPPVPLQCPSMPLQRPRRTVDIPTKKKHQALNRLTTPAWINTPAGQILPYASPQPGQISNLKLQVQPKHVHGPYATYVTLHSNFRIHNSKRTNANPENPSMDLSTHLTS